MSSCAKFNDSIQFNRMNTSVSKELHVHNAAVSNSEILNYNDEWGNLQYLEACNLKILSPGIMMPSPILVQCHISIPPENVRKPKVF